LTSQRSGFGELTFLLECDAVYILPWRWMYVCTDLYTTQL